MKTANQAPWSHAVTRRTFLRGATVSLALPWLESLPLRATETGEVVASKVPTRPPVRFGCIYFSSGVNRAHWWAKGAGADMELGTGLEPMKSFRSDMIFLRGLYNQQAVAHKSPHLGRISNLLSGGWVSTDQN